MLWSWAVVAAPAGLAGQGMRAALPGFGSGLPAAPIRVCITRIMAAPMLVIIMCPITVGRMPVAVIIVVAITPAWMGAGTEAAATGAVAVIIDHRPCRCHLAIDHV